jgi:cytoskeletal protein RodZ
MVQFNRSKSLPLILLAGMALVPFAVSLGACGGGKPAETPENASESSSSSSASESGDAAPAEPAASESASAAPSETAAAPAAPASTASTKVTTKNDPAWAACYASVKLKGKDKDVSKDVAALSKACAKATKQKQIGKTLTGKQSDSGSPQSYPLKAAAKHCYRVYAAGGEGIKDLDVAIKDSAGNVAGEDSTDMSTAIVLDDGAVCFKEADAATVVVSVGSGSGAYAVQIWGGAE